MGYVTALKLLEIKELKIELNYDLNKCFLQFATNVFFCGFYLLIWMWICWRWQWNGMSWRGIVWKTVDSLRSWLFERKLQQNSFKFLSFSSLRDQNKSKTEAKKLQGLTLSNTTENSRNSSSWNFIGFILSKWDSVLNFWILSPNSFLIDNFKPFVYKKLAKIPKLSVCKNPVPFNSTPPPKNDFSSSSNQVSFLSLMES